MEGFFIIVILAVILGLYTMTRAGTNPTEVKKQHKKSDSLTLNKGSNSVTIFCYDARSLPHLEWHEVVRLRYHSAEIRQTSIYTGTSRWCSNYLTFEGANIGSLAEDSCIPYLDKLAQHRKVYIYATACGYNKRGWPQLFASLPSNRTLAKLTQ